MDRQVSSLAMMKWTNMWQALWLFLYLLALYCYADVTILRRDKNTSDFYQALRMMWFYEGVTEDLMMFCVCACCGQLFVFQLMEEFG